MRFSLIDLQPLYNGIRQAHGNPSVPPPLPPRRSDIYAQYRRMYEHLIKDVSGFRAVYLWFAKEIGAEPEFIYVGQSQKSSVGLHRRFDNELRQWYHIFWMKAFNSDRYIQDAIDLYNTSMMDYTLDIRNQALKQGATHLVCCTDIGDTVDIDSLEYELIVLFNFPRGNDDVPRRKPSTFSKAALAIKDGFLLQVVRSSPYNPSTTAL